MKSRLLLILVCLTGLLPAYGKKHAGKGLPRSEVGLMNNVLGCLANKDSVSYFALFPPFDTLWAFVIHNPDRSPETVKALNELKEHPQDLLQFDPYYNRSIMRRFYDVLRKGEDSGIHWKDVVMERYELYNDGPSASLAGYERIAPERFKGYMFIRDVLGRLTFCITIKEIQKIQGYYFGGQVINILEASSVDQYLQKEQAEKKYLDWLAKHPSLDSTAADSSQLKSAADSIAQVKKDSLWKNTTSLRDSIINEDEGTQTRKEVLDRKFYRGTFDNEIPVELYVRYMRDPKSKKTIAYDGLYKFGDQKDYVRLVITKSAEGKWDMEDDLPLGSMELTLTNKTYTGAWLNNESQTGYDVVMNQADISEKKLELLDKILEKGLSGRADEDSDNGYGDHGKKKKKDSDDDDDDPPPVKKAAPPVQQDEGY